MSDIECPKCNGSGCGEFEGDAMTCEVCDGEGVISYEHAGMYYQENILFLYDCEHAKDLRVSVRECGLALKAAAKREHEYRTFISDMLVGATQRKRMRLHPDEDTIIFRCKQILGMPETFGSTEAS